jgi:putative membrane protein
MINYIIRLVLVGLVIYYIPSLLNKIQVDSVGTAIIVAFVMSLLNTFVKPVLALLSLPISILTLGLFYLVLTVFMVYICDTLVSGFNIEGFIQPLLFSFILSIVNSIVGSFQG